MKKILAFLKLMRPRQWFKSFFLLFGVAPAVFLMPAETALIPWLLALGIINMIMMQGVVYTINDISDVEKDRMHPSKKNRPIASGAISIKEGVVFASFLLLVALSLAYYLGFLILIITLLLLANSFAYNKKPFRLRDRKYLDVFTTALNFPLRVMVGWYLFEPFNQARFSLQYNITSTSANSIQSLFFNAPPKIVDLSVSFSTITVSAISMVLFTYFLACFLLFLKRYAEKNSSINIRKTLLLYSGRELRYLAVFSAVLSAGFILVMAISLKPLLLITMPFFVYIMFWYYRLAMEKDSPVSQPEYVFTKSKRFIFFTAIVLIVTAIILFV